MTQDESIPSNVQFLQPQSLSFSQHHHQHDSPLPTAFVSVQSPTTKLTPTKTPPKSSPPPPPLPPSSSSSPLPYWKLFRFADKLDLFLLTVALLAAIANGIIIPLVSVIFGDLINVLGDPTTTDIAGEINKVILYLVYLGIAALVCGYLEISLCLVSGARQAARVRCAYLAAFLNQDMTWFDTLTSGGNKQEREGAVVEGKPSSSSSSSSLLINPETKLLMGLNDNTLAFQAAISEKLGAYIRNISTAVAGLVIAFIQGWDIALLIVGGMPFLMGVGAAMSYLGGKLAADVSRATAAANAVAQQAIINIRTVAAYNLEHQTQQMYESKLIRPVKAGVKQGLISGFAMGITSGVFAFVFAAAIWFGSIQVADGEYDGGEVIGILFAGVMAGFALGQSVPQMQYFTTGREAAAELFAVIDRSDDSSDGSSESTTLKSITNTAAAKGIKQQRCQGQIEFNNVHFAYPSKPERTVLNGLTMTIPAGSHVALVGGSGSGKSTIIQLIERFYNPSIGCITLDGVDISGVDLKWLRGQIALVSQEPTLFNMSIADNIAIALDNNNNNNINTSTTTISDDLFKKERRMERIIEAAEAANAHDFITSLPRGYHTVLGERGTQLSGGQKQRIAIARAIFSNPRILLLDEATSALDTASEKAVQAALENLMMRTTMDSSSSTRDGTTTTTHRQSKMTVITIAHRLSTVVNADEIIVIQQGKVVERGSHQQLMTELPQGHYAGLISSQTSMAMNNYNSRSMAMNSRKSGKNGESSSLLLRSANSSSSSTAAAAAAAMYQRQASIPEEEEGGKKKHRSLKKNKRNPPSKSYGWRLAKLNQPEWLYGIGGAIGSAALGLQQPAFALALSGIVEAFYQPTASQIKEGGQKWALVYVGIGVGTTLFGTLQGWCLGVMGQQLAKRVRLLFLEAVLRQEVGWFDKEENSSAQLMSRLSVDALTVKGAVGGQIGVLVQNVATIVGAYTIALLASWKMTLVLTATLPLLVGAQYVGLALWTDNFSKGKDSVSQANQAAAEAAAAIKTVAAFSMQDAVVQRYTKAVVTDTKKKSVKAAQLSGVAYGASQFVLYGAIGLAFYYGSTLMIDGSLSLLDLMEALTALLFSTYAVAQASIQYPEIHLAAGAAARVFAIIDRRPEGYDDGDDDDDDHLNSTNTTTATATNNRGGLCLHEVHGKLEFKGVKFHYPSRPSHTVLHKMDLMIAAGTSVALVGGSGSGKSTVIQLIERFYNPSVGCITLDGVDISRVDLKWLRGQIALVSQEPVMFAGSIMDNIKFGNPNASLEHVLEAAAAANAMPFIEKLPEGLHTILGGGEGSIQLSGGQKQRVAIARALLRNPGILLLDEATSALDSENEALVQSALELLQEGRTTVVVAHRLATVVGCDKIVVMQGGRVVEEGVHGELMEKEGGYYASLFAASQCGGGGDV